MKIPALKLSYGKRLNPARDWTVLIAFAVLAIVVSLAWNLWLFNRVASGALLGEAPESTPAAFDQATLDTLTKVFTERAVEYAKYKDGTHRFIDPSR